VLVGTFKSRVGAVVIPILPVNRRAFDIWRHEWRAFRTRTLNAVSPAYHQRVRQLRGQRHLSVNIGSGGKGLPGWVNVEIMPMADTTLCLDIRRPLPLADGSVARLLAEHVIEHVDFRDELPVMLGDWYRVLEPGGTVRIVVPDAKRYLEAYVCGEPERWHALGWDPARLPYGLFTPMHVINHVFHQGGEHLFAYDFETLSWALGRAGFTTIAQTRYQVSRDPQLAIDQANHAPYSLYVEAIK
jgi:predicted SAM-dependent methyltransferase